MLVRELRECMIGATSLDVWERLRRCAATLSCVWDGKAKDGRQPAPSSWNKERANLFRWTGAPDIAIPLADLLVRWQVRLRQSVWNRGDARIAPQRFAVGKNVDPSAEAGMASVWQMVMDFFLYLGQFEFSYEFEHFNRVVETFGYSVLLADWRKAKRLHTRHMTLQQIVDARVRQMLVENGSDGQGVDMDAITQQVQAMMDALLMDTSVSAAEFASLPMLADPEMPASEGEQVMKQLRASPDKPAEYFVPKDEGGQPVLRSFIPWVQCVHSHDMSGTGNCALFGYPEYYTESEVRAAALAEGWDKKATKEMLEKHKNQLFYELFAPMGVTVPDWALNGTGIGFTPDKTVLEKIPHWMVFRVWRKITNKQGMPTVYRGVLHHCMSEKMLLWEATDLTEIPIIVDTSERVNRVLIARGVPDVIISHQNGIKDITDGEAARGQLGSNPPFLRAAGSWIGMKPGLELNGDALKRGMAENLNTFIKVPEVDQGALKISAELERWAKEYYCYAQTTDPDDKRLYMEDLTFKSLRVMCRTLLTLWWQIQDNVTEVSASHIAGRPVKLNVTDRDQLRGQADVHVGFHVDGLMQDKADGFFDILIKLMQADRVGVVDWAEAVQMAVQMRAPAYARRLLKTPEQAVQDVVKDQHARMAQIGQGVPVTYDEHCINPPQRMEEMQKWLSVPDNAPKTQTAAELVQKEFEYLQFQMQQQTENPTTGRTGVKPNDMKEMTQLQPAA